MKAYLEVKDILGRLNFNDIDFVSIVNIETGNVVDRIQWGHSSYEKIQKKAYMNEEPIGITAKVTDEAKMEIVVEYCPDIEY